MHTKAVKETGRPEQELTREDQPRLQAVSRFRRLKFTPELPAERQYCPVGWRRETTVIESK
ncbi:MAG: hypothetical protein AVO34_04005 [Firmicutes bacterium ML8_F2]|nr:MAG: hypothetical protein AVO34_04005 [Firmicutes bacterium ML8_F2]